MRRFCRHRFTETQTIYCHKVSKAGADQDNVCINGCDMIAPVLWFHYGSVVDMCCIHWRWSINWPTLRTAEIYRQRVANDGTNCWPTAAHDTVWYVAIRGTAIQIFRHRSITSDAQDDLTYCPDGRPIICPAISLLCRQISVRCNGLNCTLYAVAVEPSALSSDLPIDSIALHHNLLRSACSFFCLPRLCSFYHNGNYINRS